MRRVSALHAARDGGHEALWEWEEESDRFVWRGEGRPEDALPADRGNRLPTAVEFMEKMRREGPSDWSAARRLIVQFAEVEG